MTEGDFKGLEYVELKATQDLKGNKLSLKNISSALEKEQNFLKIPNDPNNPFCLYNLLHRQVFDFLPEVITQDRILRREAPKKLLKKWVISGEKYRADPGANGVWGQNYPNTVAVKLAKLCGYDNPTKCTAHGRRKCSASALANSKENISNAEQRNRTRHKTEKHHVV
jgi:hypothetical protein